MLPLKTVWEIAWAKQEVQYTPHARALGLGRCVKQQRAHDQCVATLQRACNHRPSTTSRGGGLGSDATAHVRARNHLEWTVTVCARVKVYADGNQPFEHFDRRLNEEASLLLGPSAQSRVAHACCYRNAQVLMDCDEPVARHRLLEICALGCHVVARHNGSDNRMLPKPRDECLTPTKGKETSRTH